MDEDHQERKLTTILSADIEGYSRMMARDESGTLAEVQHLRRVEIDPRIKRHNGRTVKLMGDGSLVEFASVVDAVRFAVDMQHAIAATQDHKANDERIRFRIGINVGDVIVDGEDIYGDGVNVAARIEGLANPGGICIARNVFDQVNDKLDLTFVPMGLQRVKNIPVLVETYLIEIDDLSRLLATGAPRRAAPADEPVQPELRNVGVAAIDISEAHSSDFDISLHFDALQKSSQGIAEILQDFDGTELANDGTSFLAVFGHPVAHSKDAERGLRFANAVMAYANREMPSASISCSMVSGVVLASGGNGTGVLGDPVRRSRTLLAKTPTGAIAVDRGVYRATQDIANFNEIEDEVWQLLQIPEGAPTSEISGFVGRERELRQIVELLEDVAEEKRGEVILLRGEAGIGKTRLGQEAADQARKLGFEVSTCRVLDFGQGREGNSLGMIAIALSTEAPDGMNLIETAVWKEMVRPAELSEAEHLAIRELDENSLLEEQTGILKRLAASVTKNSPVVLVVEDVHWAHPNVIKSLADLAAEIDGLPLVLLLTTRPENDPMDRSWRIRAGKTTTTTIDLQPLRRRAALTLAQNISDLDGGLLSLCLERANGNPLFIEQLVLWAEDQSNMSLPLSVQSVVQERLDKLAPETRRMAQSASILGQVFQVEALEAVYGRSVDGTDGLSASHLVVRRAKTIAFVHALVREGIYGSISPHDRRDLHLRAARHFKPDDPVLAARHTYWSGIGDAALTCYKVARREHEEGRLDTAQELAQLALKRCDKADMRARCQLLLGEVLRDRELYSEAIDAFLSVAAADEETEIRSLVNAAESHFRIDQHDKTMLLLDKAEKILPLATDAFWKTTIAHLKAGVEFSRSNKDANFAYAHAAVQASEQLNDKPLRAKALSTLGDAEMMSGLSQVRNATFASAFRFAEMSGCNDML